MNISILKQNKLNFWVLGEGFSRNGSWPWVNGSSSFCATGSGWSHYQTKHLSVWRTGQGDWKYLRRSRFDSWQIAAQAESLRWTGNYKFCSINASIFINSTFATIWQQVDLTATYPLSRIPAFIGKSIKLMCVCVCDLTASFMVLRFGKSHVVQRF